MPVIANTCDTTTSYIVTFTAVDECENRNFTTATFTIMGGISSNGSNLPEEGFSLYPNPVDDVLTLEMGDLVSLPVHLSLFDDCGNRLWSGQDSKAHISIPLSQYASGIYFLQIEMKNRTYSRVVIKQ
jgi:Secretion system C-terminal sorting domain